MIDLRAEMRQSCGDVKTSKCSRALPKNHNI